MRCNYCQSIIDPNKVKISNLGNYCNSGCKSLHEKEIFANKKNDYMRCEICEACLGYSDEGYSLCGSQKCEDEYNRRKDLQE